jgi:hypothetical protein
MTSIHAKGTEEHKSHGTVFVGVETSGEILTFIRVGVAVLNPVCTLVHVRVAYIIARLCAS